MTPPATEHVEEHPHRRSEDSLGVWFRKVVTTVTGAIILAALVWMARGLWEQTRAALLAGYAETSSVDALERANAKEHLSIKNDVASIDDKTDALYQVLIEGERKEVVKARLGIKRMQRERERARIENDSP